MVRYGSCWSCGYEGRARSWGSGGRIAEGVRGVEANRRNGGGRSGSGESDREGKGKGDDPASGWKRGSSDLGVGYVEFCGLCWGFPTFDKTFLQMESSSRTILNS